MCNCKDLTVLLYERDSRRAASVTTDWHDRPLPGACTVHCSRACNDLLAMTAEQVNAIARDVCLSDCLLARSLKNACMDDILCVDRCQDMDELINF